IDPCGTCNLFWPLFKDMTPLEAIRTGIDYCAYIARYRPIGKRPPQTVKSELPGADTLVQLRKNHQEASERSKSAPVIE
ncbi:MAG TPA: hypothetical protein VIM73_17250, partial [Polyangiaceae bacterium]